MTDESLLAKSREGIWKLLQRNWLCQQFSPEQKYKLLLKWSQEETFEAGEGILRDAGLIGQPPSILRDSGQGAKAPFLLKLDEETLEFAVLHKNAVLLHLLSRAIDEHLACKEIEHANEMRETERKHQLTLKRSERRWQLAKRISKYRRLATPAHRSLNFVYLAVLLTTIVVIAILLHYGLAQTPTVNVEFNVGEIIAGLLVGTGALVAGVAYARKVPSRANE